MPYANTTFTELKALLKKRVGGAANFWVEHEFNIAVNEALSVWQVLVGEFSAVSRLDIASLGDEVEDLYFPATGTSDFQTVTSTQTPPLPLSVWRIGTYTTTTATNVLVGSNKLIVASVAEYDYGYPGWRTGTAGTPNLWAPYGLNKVVFSPRPNADLRLDYYSGDRLMHSENDSIQVGDEELNRILDYAVWQLNVKSGTEEAFNTTNPLRELFLTAANLRNQKLRGSQLYKNFMGEDRGEEEPNRDAKPKQGAR